jgi:hypothetical protein
MTKTIKTNNSLSQSELLKYIGRDYNETIKNEIELKFRPYTLQLCNYVLFWFRDIRPNNIRCLVENGKIVNLCFN